MEREKLKEKAWFYSESRSNAFLSPHEMFDDGFDAGWNAAQSWVRIETEADLPQVDKDVLVTDGYRYEVAFQSSGEWSTEELARVIAWMQIPPYDQTDGC